MLTFLVDWFSGVIRELLRRGRTGVVFPVLSLPSWGRSYHPPLPFPSPALDRSSNPFCSLRGVPVSPLYLFCPGEREGGSRRTGWTIRFCIESVGDGVPQAGEGPDETRCFRQGHPSCSFVLPRQRLSESKRFPEPAPAVVGDDIPPGDPGVFPPFLLSRVRCVSKVM